MMRHRRDLLPLAVLTALASSGYGQSSAPRHVTWDREVRPALEAGVCFEALRAERAAQAMPCTASAAIAPELADLAWVMADRMALIARMPSLRQPVAPGPPAVPGGLPDMSAPFAALRRVVLDDRRILSGVMAEVAGTLARLNLACDGCPAPVGPARSFALADLKPYLAPYVWPAAMGPDGQVSLAICVGKNGLHRLISVDRDLADAAVLSIMGNQAAYPRLTPLVQEAKRREAFLAATSDDAKLDALRAELAALLPADAEFLAAVEAAASEVLPRVGMRCTDCRTRPPASPE